MNVIGWVFQMVRLPSLDDYLDAIQELDWLDDLLFRTIVLIPDRYFYQPWINGSEFESMRHDIESERQKLNSSAYRNDKNVQSKVKRLAWSYERSLKDLVLEQKSDLLLYLIYLDSDAKRAYLAETITRYRLLPHLFGEVW